MTRHVPLLALLALALPADPAAGGAASPVADLAPLAPVAPPAPTTPDWNDAALRACQGECNWAYATEPLSYNVCYACFCLLRSAETVGELESALAQCRAELGRHRQDAV